jgi:hypothetical protein
MLRTIRYVRIKASRLLFLLTHFDAIALCHCGCLDCRAPSVKQNEDAFSVISQAVGNIFFWLCQGHENSSSR